MPNDPPPPTGQTGSSTTIKVERRCPACHALLTKTEPTLVQVRAAADSSLDSFRTRIQQEDNRARLGYCGSVVAGAVGNPKKPHFGLEPDIRGECGTNYDIDGFIVSDAWCGNIRPFKGKRWANRWGKSHRLEKAIRKELKTQAHLAHLKPGDEAFSLVLWKHSEQRQADRKPNRYVF